MLRRKLYLSLQRRMRYALRHSEAYRRTGNARRCPQYVSISRLYISLHPYITHPATQN